VEKMHNKTSNKRAILHVGKGPEMSPDVAGVSHEPIASNPKQCMEEPSAPANGKPVFSLDFAGLMPLHSPEEYFGLAADIVLKGGCHDPIKVWHDVEQDRDVLLDGYLRLEICIDNQIQLPEVVFVDLPNRDAAREWVIDQQLNRRNLGIWWAAYFRGLKYTSEKLEAHRPLPTKLHHFDGVKGETADRIAKNAHLSSSTIERNARFARDIDRIKNDVGPEFGVQILNRVFKRLFMKDIRQLARMPAKEKVAIANALNTNPTLSLEEAKKSIRLQELDESSSTGTVKTNAETSNDTATSPSEVRQILNGIKSRHEADLTKLSNILVEFDATEDSEAIPTMIETEREIITAAKDVIKAAKDTIAALEEIQRNSDTDQQ
jgi:hypothetical protein